MKKIWIIIEADKKIEDYRYNLETFLCEKIFLVRCVAVFSKNEAKPCLFFGLRKA